MGLLLNWTLQLHAHEQYVNTHVDTFSTGVMVNSKKYTVLNLFYTNF
jgi:hypothetical protein